MNRTMRIFGPRYLLELYDDGVKLLLLYLVLLKI